MPHLDMFSSRDLEDLCRETSTKLKIVPVVVEKDYWTCWVLDRLFSDPLVSGQIMFKGGTTILCEWLFLQKDRTIWKDSTCWKKWFPSKRNTIPVGGLRTIQQNPVR